MRYERDTPAHIRGLAVFADTWLKVKELAIGLAEIIADVREAVAHWRRVRDDALYKSTSTLLYYFTV